MNRIAFATIATLLVIIAWLLDHPEHNQRLFVANVTVRPAPADPGCMEDEAAVVDSGTQGPGLEWVCVTVDDLGEVVTVDG